MAGKTKNRPLSRDCIKISTYALHDSEMTALNRLAQAQGIGKNTIIRPLIVQYLEAQGIDLDEPMAA
jgi:hypothetical protein